MRTLLKLSPVLLPFLVLFAGGLFMAVAQSLGYFLPLENNGPFWQAYAKLLEPRYARSFGLSLYVALVSSFLCVALGSLLACAIWKIPARIRPLATIYKIPLILPHIAVAFIVLVFWTQSGVVASLCHHLGLIDSPGQFPSLLYGGSGAGMILAYVYKGTPFVVLLALAVLARLDPRLVQTARMLGASRARVFFRVVLPHLWPVAHTTFIILFLYSFGAFDIPFLLGESSPSMLSIEAYNSYFRRDLANRPTAMAILVVMFLFSAVFIALYSKLVSRLQGKERKL